MSLPEISHRCVSCGAAVRAGARFCPQCGNAVFEGASRTDAASASPEDPTPTTRDAELPRASAPPAREVYAAASESESSTQTPRAAGASVQSDESHALSSESHARGAESSVLGAESPARGRESSVSGDGARVVVPQTDARRAVPDTGDLVSPYASATAQQRSRPEDGAASEERRGRVARVREEARTRVENTRARVERVKGDALVALEETPDDSGLRFVGVAVFLFVLFLLFLFLSVTVLR
jgi:predicted  nucleic acid-binding Zn-ribbon protein